MLIPLLAILIILPLPLIAQKDECNYHATLSEKEKFFLTQPFKTQMELNMSDLFHSFEVVREKLPLFQNLIDNYATNEKLNKLEPLPLYPLDRDTNLIFLDQSIPTIKAPLLCSEHGASLISPKKADFAKVASIMKSLNLTLVPFFALAYQNSVYNKELSLLEVQQDQNKLKYLQSIALPFLTSQGTISYPSKPSESSSELTATDFSYPILCSKPNNPWDLEENKPTWFKILTKVKKALSTLSHHSDLYSFFIRKFQNLRTSQRSPLSRGLLAKTPEFFKKIVNFLDTFSSPHSWETTTSSGFAQFEEFTGNVDKSKAIFKN